MCLSPSACAGSTPRTVTRLRAFTCLLRSRRAVGDRLTERRRRRLNSERAWPTQPLQVVPSSRHPMIDTVAMRRAYQAETDPKPMSAMGRKRSPGDQWQLSAKSDIRKRTSTRLQASPSSGPINRNQVPTPSSSDHLRNVSLIIAWGGNAQLMPTRSLPRSTSAGSGVSAALKAVCVSVPGATRNVLLTAMAPNAPGVPVSNVQLMLSAEVPVTLNSMATTYGREEVGVLMDSNTHVTFTGASPAFSTPTTRLRSVFEVPGVNAWQCAEAFAWEITSTTR